MNPEQFDILRRIAERGRDMAQRVIEIDHPEKGDRLAGRIAAHQSHLDLWQHLLDELERVKPMGWPVMSGTGSKPQ